MKTTPHILIIGAGLLGLATARACVDRGAKVTIAERQSRTGLGAGFANSGMIHPSQAWPWVTGDLNETSQLQAARDVAELARNSVAALKDRMERLELPDASRGTGCFKVFQTTSLRDVANIQYGQIGIKTQITDILGRPALEFPDDFSGSAYSWCLAESRALIEDGVKIYTQAEVTLHEDNGQIFAVLDGQPIKADHIILCTGYSTNEMLRALGLSLPIKPVKGFALDFDVDGIDLTSLPQAPIMDAASNSALTLFDKTLRLSGTLGQQTARPLWQRWCELAPDIMSTLGAPDRVWSGSRPVSALGRPIMAQSPFKGLSVNSGHGHMGWTLSMVSGHFMARMILDEHHDTRFAWPQG